MLDGSGSELGGPSPLRRSSSIESPPQSNQTPGRLTRRASLDDLENESCQLTPKIEHRIVIISSDEVSTAPHGVCFSYLVVWVEIAGVVPAETADRAGLGDPGGGGRVFSAKLVDGSNRPISWPTVIEYHHDTSCINHAAVFYHFVSAFSLLLVLNVLVLSIQQSAS